jgi:hypothetical protein
MLSRRLVRAVLVVACAAVLALPAVASARPAGGAFVGAKAAESRSTPGRTSGAETGWIIIAGIVVAAGLAATGRAAARAVRAPGGALASVR